MTDSIRELTILQPDDWHIHLRDDKALATTVPHAAQSFNRVICMPNLVPPVKNVDDAHAYRARIMQQLEASNLSTERKAAFDPRMTLYLTDNTSEIAFLKIMIDIIDGLMNVTLTTSQVAHLLGDTQDDVGIATADALLIF